MSHALTRTSPKGEDFVGKCIKCNMENIPLSHMHDHCENTNDFSDQDALMIVCNIKVLRALH